MKIVVVGATGLVGQEILKVMQERNFAFDELYLVASSRNVGKEIEFKAKRYAIIGLEEACKQEEVFAKERPARGLSGRCGARGRRDGQA